MKIESMMIELTHGCRMGMLGKYSIKTETAFISHWDVKDEEFSLKKSLMKAINSLKNWDDHMQISIREYEYGSYTRTWFITRDFGDSENGTMTIARCAADGTFELEDRKHKAVNVIKKEIGSFVDSLEFIET